MRKPLIAGNWKMQGSLDDVRQLLAGIKAGIGNVTRAEVAVCPPFVFIPEARTQLQNTPVVWGGQDLSTHPSGAYTGEIAGSMLQDFGCTYVIVGHSERRAYHQESDVLVAEKFVLALNAGLTPIFCVGETLAEREHGSTEAVVGRQVDAVLQRGGIDLLGRGVIAYEPVWAIGTGRTASPEQAQAVHAFIRNRLAAHRVEVAQAMRILYGGSMKPENAAALLAKPDIDGGLIGGASLKADDFLGICTAAN